QDALRTPAWTFQLERHEPLNYTAIAGKALHSSPQFFALASRGAQRIASLAHPCSGHEEEAHEPFLPGPGRDACCCGLRCRHTTPNGPACRLDIGAGPPRR